MEKIFFRTPFNYDRDAVSLDTGVKCLDPSLVREADALDADINVIMKRYTQTGQFPVFPLQQAWMNGSEFPDGFDFRMAQDLIAQGRQAFMGLPADIRSKFNNDPAFFVEFCSDENNLPALRKMGLANPVSEAPAAAGDSITPPAPSGREVRSSAPAKPAKAGKTPPAGSDSGA